MAKNRLPFILDDGDYLMGGDSSLIAELGSIEFLQWLQHNNSFRFKCGFGDKDGYTVRKEGKWGYWYGYKKIAGKLHKKYVGPCSEVTLDRLLVVAKELHTPKETTAKKLHNTHQNKEESTQDKVAALNEHIKAAQKILAEIQREIQATTGTHKQNQAELQELQQEINSLNSKIVDLEQVNQSLQAQIDETNRLKDTEIKELQQQLCNLEAKNQELDTENQNLKKVNESLGKGQALQQRDAREVMGEFLATLKMGKQAPDYKAAKKWASKFVEFCEESKMQPLWD